MKLVVHLPGEKVEEAVELLKSLSTRPGVVYNMAASDNPEEELPLVSAVVCKPELQVDPRLCADFPLDDSYGDPRLFKWDPVAWKYRCLVCRKCVDDKHLES